MPTRIASLIAVLTLAFAASAQSVPSAEIPAETSWIPRPVVLIGPSLDGNGYQSVALSGTGALLMNSNRLISDTEASYMDARKVNDNTVDNDSGHERSLESRMFYKAGHGMYFGGGAQWSETSTTNYVKQAWRPVAGAGGDHFGNSYSLRWQAVYVTSGTDHYNGLHGPEIQIWFPSPASRSHFLFRETLGIYQYHSTVTDPADPVLTAQEKANRSTAAFLDFVVGWRF